jgi:hypothetical protein
MLPSSARKVPGNAKRAVRSFFALLALIANLLHKLISRVDPETNKRGTMFGTMEMPLSADDQYGQVQATATVQMEYNDGRWVKVKGRISFQKDSTRQSPLYRLVLEGHIVQSKERPVMIEHNNERHLDIDFLAIDLPLLQMQVTGRKFASTNAKARSVFLSFPAPTPGIVDGVKSIRVTTILSAATDHGKYFLKSIQQEQERSRLASQH